MLRRWSLGTLLLLSAAVCGPSAPLQSATAGTPSANVHPTGALSFPSCTAEGCTFQGSVTNDGPDCASNVRGVTHLFDEPGKEIATQSWEILGRLRRGDRTYSGCCFSQAAVDAFRSYRTDVSFEPLPCI
jgi:hypothetical protein